MPSAPPAVNAVAHLRGAARRAQTASAAPVCSNGTSSAAAMGRGDHLRRAAEVMRRIFKTSYYDPLFERPELVEDDYYRFRNQPRGY